MSTGRKAVRDDLPAVFAEQLRGRQDVVRIGIHRRLGVRVRIRRARRDRPVGGQTEPPVISVDPALLVNKVLEGLAEVELAQDRPHGRIVEVRLEIVELERVPVNKLVALRAKLPGLGQVVVGHITDRDLVARRG